MTPNNPGAPHARNPPNHTTPFLVVMTSIENARRAKHGEAIIRYANSGNGDLSDDATDTLADVLHCVAAELGIGAAENVAARAIMHFRNEHDA